jgi:hypothetical protein
VIAEEPMNTTRHHVESKPAKRPWYAHGMCEHRRAGLLPLLLACVLLAPLPTRASCGDRPGDLDRAHEAASAAVAACPCTTPTDVARRRCLRTSTRRARRLGIDLRTSCRHVAFQIAAETPCQPDLSGFWVLTGAVTSNECSAFFDFATVLRITQDGTALFADARSIQFAGTVDQNGWMLHDLFPIPPLVTCPADRTHPYEQTVRIEGGFPDATGVATVEQRLIEYNAIVPPTPQCPGCTATWQGTMTRAPGATR